MKASSQSHINATCHAAQSNFHQTFKFFIKKLTNLKTTDIFINKKYLDKVFLKKGIVLQAFKKKFICIPPFIGKKSLQLRTRLVNSIESNLKFFKLKVIFQPPCKRNFLFRYKDSLKKNIPLTLFTDTRAVVTAKLLVMVKHTDTFLLELHRTWVFLI